MYLIKIFQKEYYLGILVITLPLLVAVSPALFNIGLFAIQQIQHLGR